MASTFNSRLGTTPGEGIKAPVKAASTSNLTLSGEQTVNGTVITAGDRVLVRAQADATENGIYVCSTTTWTRAPDWDASSDVANGVLVLETANGVMYRSSYSGTFTLGTTEVSFEAIPNENSANVVYSPAGTGAVDSTVQAKLREFVSVKDFGAVGDGVTDDTAAFNAVIDYANSISSTGSSGMETSGVTIYIPDGTYSIPSGLNSYIQKDNIFFVGASPDSAIISSTSGVLFRWGDSGDLTTPNGGGIKNLKFLYSTPTSSAVCIDVPNAVRLRFEGIRLRRTNIFARLGSTSKVAIAIGFNDIRGWSYNSGFPTFNLINGAGFYLTQSVFFNADVPVPTTGNDHSAVAGTDFILCVGSWDTVLIDSVTCNRYYRSFYISLGTGFAVTNWKISKFYGDLSNKGCVIETLVVGANPGPSISHLSFSKCWFVGTNGNSVTLEVKDSLKGLMQHINFDDCEFSFSWQYGFKATCPGSNIQNLKIVNSKTLGNAISTFGDGVYLDGVADILIHGNTLGTYQTFGSFDGQAQNGLTILSTCRRYVVTSNNSEGTVSDYNISDPAVQVAACRVRNNMNGSGALPSYATLTTDTAPGSGVADTNTSPFEVEFLTYGGTVTSQRINSVKYADGGNASVILRPGDSWDAIYTVAPGIVKKVMP